MIVRHSFTRRRATARAGLRYYQMRPRGDGEGPRQLFTGEGTVSRDEAYRLLDAHQPPRGYLAHRLLLSPSAEECPADLRALTARVLDRLAREKGQALHWVAVEHRNTAHPHVHVVLCGGGERDGQAAEVRLGRADYATLREEGAAHCRVETQVRDEWLAALGRADGARVARGREA